ncbi:MAG: DUF1361 domain-containing protein [Clostridiales bacterium]|nr:DUF1361 domain-containing protein [Clostridiales bacterium]
MSRLIAAVRTNRKLSETLYLVFLSLLCCGLLAARVTYTGSRYFTFLIWNLFLAFIPWMVSTALRLMPLLRKSRLITLLLFCVWLLFFPNAPYILTDLFHLGTVNDAPVWFDLVMLLSFALTGMLLCFMSLWDIENLLKSVMNKTAVKVLVSLLLFVCAFGIYLGRYLRWNSWDIISSPLGLVTDMAMRILKPDAFPGAWGMTLLYGVFLNIAYIAYRSSRDIKLTMSKW